MENRTFLEDVVWSATLNSPFPFRSRPPAFRYGLYLLPRCAHARNQSPLIVFNGSHDEFRVPRINFSSSSLGYLSARIPSASYASWQLDDPWQPAGRFQNLCAWFGCAHRVLGRSPANSLSLRGVALQSVRFPHDCSRTLIFTIFFSAHSSFF